MASARAVKRDQGRQGFDALARRCARRISTGRMYRIRSASVEGPDESIVAGERQLHIRGGDQPGGVHEFAMVGVQSNSAMTRPTLHVNW